MELIVQSCMSVSEVEWAPHLMDFPGTAYPPRAYLSYIKNYANSSAAVPN